MFFNQTTYSTGASSSPVSVAVVDVNNDNKPDIVVANSGTTTVGVLLNTGNGSFPSQTTYSTGATSSPIAVSVVDVNGDNRPDIVVANSGTANVGVFLNVGNGTFLNQTTYSTGISSSPRGVTTVDVNGDGKPDIVVSNSGTSNVGVLLNAGNGTFLNQTTHSTDTGSSPRGLTIVDVNGDSKPDIVVANSGTHNVGIFFNAGNGTFLNQTTYSTGASSAPRAVAVADVNGDNMPDIIPADTGINSVGVLLNAGNSTFLNQTTYSTGATTGPRTVAVADVNNDNKPDIIVGNTASTYVSVLLNIGNGTFLNQTTYSTGATAGPSSISVVDVNNDNKPDIVVVNSAGANVGVFLHC